MEKGVELLKPPVLIIGTKQCTTRNQLRIIDLVRTAWVLFIFTGISHPYLEYHERSEPKQQFVVETYGRTRNRKFCSNV